MIHEISSKKIVETNNIQLGGACVGLNQSLLQDEDTVAAHYPR